MKKRLARMEILVQKVCYFQRAVYFYYLHTKREISKEKHTTAENLKRLYQLYRGAATLFLLLRGEAILEQYIASVCSFFEEEECIVEEEGFDCLLYSSYILLNRKPTSKVKMNFLEFSFSGKSVTVKPLKRNKETINLNVEKQEGLINEFINELESEFKELLEEYQKVYKINVDKTTGRDDKLIASLHPLEISLVAQSQQDPLYWPTGENQQLTFDLQRTLSELKEFGFFKIEDFNNTNLFLSWKSCTWTAGKRKGFKVNPAIKHLCYSNPELKSRNNISKISTDEDDDDNDRDMVETYDQTNLALDLVVEDEFNFAQNSSSSSAVANSSAISGQQIEISNNEVSLLGVYTGEDEKRVTEKFKQDLIVVTQQSIAINEKKTMVIKNYVKWLYQQQRSPQYKSVYLDIYDRSMAEYKSVPRSTQEINTYGKNVRRVLYKMGMEQIEHFIVHLVKEKYPANFFSELKKEQLATRWKILLELLEPVDKENMENYCNLARMLYGNIFHTIDNYDKDSTQSTLISIFEKYNDNKPAIGEEINKIVTRLNTYPDSAIDYSSMGGGNSNRKRKAADQGEELSEIDKQTEEQEELHEEQNVTLKRKGKKGIFEEDSEENKDEEEKEEEEKGEGKQEEEEEQQLQQGEGVVAVFGEEGDDGDDGDAKTQKSVARKLFSVTPVKRNKPKIYRAIMDKLMEVFNVNGNWKLSREQQTIELIFDWLESNPKPSLFKHLKASNVWRYVTTIERQNVLKSQKLSFLRAHYFLYRDLIEKNTRLPTISDEDLLKLAVQDAEALLLNHPGKAEYISYANKLQNLGSTKREVVVSFSENEFMLPFLWKYVNAIDLNSINLLIETDNNLYEVNRIFEDRETTTAPFNYVSLTETAKYNLFMDATSVELTPTSKNKPRSLEYHEVANQILKILSTQATEIKNQGISHDDMSLMKKVFLQYMQNTNIDISAVSESSGLTTASSLTVDTITTLTAFKDELLSVVDDETKEKIMNAFNKYVNTI